MPTSRCSKLLVGSTSIRQNVEILRAVSVHSDTFIDVGSGIGQLVTFAAAYSKCAHANGTFWTKSSSIKMKFKRARAVREAKNTESYTFDPRKDANFTEMMSSVRAIQNVIHGEINTAQTQIKSQLEVNVCGPKEMSNKEMQKRRLCRIPIHIYDPDYIWREFMGYDAPKTVGETNVEKVRNEEEYMEVDEEEETPEIAPPPRQMEVSLGNTGDADIDEMIAEIYGPQIITEMNDDNDGGYTRDLITYYTRARACDTDCPKMDIEEAAAVCERIRDHQRLVLVETIQPF
ncbi:hypothetical protein L5515_012514 [Caenorhabditis briggsae]|uniref:DOT1 domain-containing protein n=1 Tax=Caenorhabditis briggsae TaxID=6238 RepID=A0AAE9JJ68_CAEBR|nr:hypothetical protein L5515_012514 [Caenorhabditis briggsae]